REAQEAIEELRFYLDQKMVPEAQTALARLTSLAPANPALTELRGQFYVLRQRQADEAAAEKAAKAAAAAAKEAAAVKAKQPKPVEKAKAVPSEFSFDLDLEEPAPADGHAAHAHGEKSGDDLEILDLGKAKPAAPPPSKSRVSEPVRPAAAAKQTSPPISPKP